MVDKTPQIGGVAIRAEWGGPTRATDITCVPHVDGTGARRAEQTPFISKVVDLQGFLIRTRNALSRASAVKSSHLRNPGRLAWHDRTPVGCGVQPKRLVMVRERGRLAKAARSQPWRNQEQHGQTSQRPAGIRFRMVNVYSADGALRSIEDSLKRLGIDRRDFSVDSRPLA
jgi:hypothetical protein